MVSFDKLRLGLIAFDPGLVRLRAAVRVLVTVIAVCSALLLLHRWQPMPAAAYAMAMITALQGAVAIKDATVGARALSRVYAATCGFAVIAAISVLDHSLPLMNLLLLIVIFLAVYARRFGARWQGVGVFAFMCGVVGAFLKAPDTQLGDIAIALVLSGVIAHLVRNFIMPERPMRDFQQMLAAAVALSRKLHETIDQKSAGRWTPAERRRALATERQARDLILLCESYLPPGQAKAPEDVFAAMATRLFDLHLAMESALAAALRTTDDGPSDTADIARKSALFQEAGDSVTAMAARMPTAFPATQGPDAGKPVTVFPTAGAWLTDTVFRQAVQVTLASAIAMVGGLALSQERWFWAVMTAFLIFTNTQSRGDVAVKGLNRALGTAVGICFGIALATLVNGRLDWSLPLIAVSVFAAFYLSALSYSAMTFFITITISLVYGLIEIFTPGLLVLRLEETAIGAMAGIFVSLAVLPLSTGRQISQATDGFMKALQALVDVFIARRDASDAGGLMPAAAAVEKARATIVTAADPMLSPWTLGLAQAGTRRVLARTAKLAHAGRLLARHYTDTPPTEGDLARLQGIRAELEDLAANGRDMSGRSRVADMARLPDAPVAAEPEADVAYELDLMAYILHQAQPANQER